MGERRFRTEDGMQPMLFESDVPEPTNAMPGSLEKVEILARRYLAGQQLWHPEDRLIYDEHDAD